MMILELQKAHNRLSETVKLNIIKVESISMIGKIIRLILDIITERPTAPELHD